MNNNYYYGNPYQPYPPYQPPKKRGSGVLLFMLWVGLLTIASYVTNNYIQNRNSTNLPTDAEEGTNYGFTVRPNDPLFNQQYALQKINASGGWQYTSGRSNLIVAVIDTGVDPNHPDLKGKLVNGYNFVDNNSDFTDKVGHGTFVASLIAAPANDKVGISGVAPGVKIMPLKVLNTRKDGSSVQIGRAIRYAVDNGAKVINVSLGSPVASRSIKSAVDYALSKNVVIVAASGNEGDEENYPSYPASFSGVISVGATTSKDEIAAFSTHNRAVSLSAPGVNIVGARSSQNQICRPYTSNNYCISSGTSFSAPYVAGAAALLLSINPDLTPAQVKSLLERTAQDLGTRGRDDYFGYGRLNIGKAVEAARAA
jgi:type VII secretion-associated serine protease mycosin